MDFEGLNESPIGRLVPISGTTARTGAKYNSFAFVPDSLPATVNLTPATWTLVAAAEAAIARLDQAASQVAVPALLRAPTLRREAQSTTALEGTYAPLEDVLGPDGHEAQTPEALEVLNFVRVGEEAFAWPRTKPLTAKALCGLHRILVDGTPSDGPDAGKLRDRQVFIGRPDAPIAQARFIPPPPGKALTGALDDLLRWVNSPPTALPSVVAAGLAHYQLETVHPFSDGNGRIGRLLIVLQLMRHGALANPVLVVSPWFERHQREYHDALLTLSVSGDWDAWIRFFATGIERSATATARLVSQLLGWQSDTVAKVRAAGVRGVAERVADELAGFPVLRAGWVADRHGVTQQAAMNALRRLTELGILQESATHGGRVFVARDVIRILSGPAA